jgi:hypothetical protein
LLQEECLTKINICFEEIIKEQEEQEDGDEKKPHKIKDLVSEDKDGCINLDGKCHILFAQKIGVSMIELLQRPEPLEGQP